tara:strand:- start:506 stop:1495 length:990 start_codon:yes stop_codon:yes gene_type:complete
MSFMLLGILNSQAAAGGWDPSTYAAYSLISADDNSDMAEINGTVVIWRSKNTYWRQTGGPGSSWSSYPTDNQVGGMGANANVFVAIPNDGNPQHLRVSPTAAYNSWVTVPSSYAYWNVKRGVIADKLDPNAWYTVAAVSRVDSEFSAYSLNNGQTNAGSLSYAQQSHALGDWARSSTEWMIIPAYSNQNQNDFVYWTGTGASWTQRTGSLNWNDGGRSVTSDGTNFYGTRGNSKQTWKRTGTNTFTTAVNPTNVAGESILYYAFGKFLYWQTNIASYWYSDTWDGGWTQVSTGSVKFTTDTRRNLAITSDSMGKVYAMRKDVDGYIVIG